MGDVFLIGGKGLEKIGGEPINIYPGGVYGYGYSSSPDRVVVTDISDEWVTFSRYPYLTTHREQLKLFRNIAQKGTVTKLAGHQRFADTLGGDTLPEWMQREMDHFRAVLCGERGATWNRDDMIQVGVRVKYCGAGDGWSEFERHYPHAVSGSFEKDGVTILESFDFNKSAAAELCHQCNIGTLPDFEWVEEIPYH